MSRFVLAIDQGTTSSRAILVDHDGMIQGIAQREHTQHFPQPGWVEHDAAEIWANTLGVVEEIMADVPGEDIAAVGITNQRETTLLWNRATGETVSRAIVWQDTRTDGMVGDLARDGGIDRFRATTGLPLSPYFSATKIAWILRDPDLRARAEAGELAFGTMDTWVVWNLTGGTHHITDVTNASRTMLMDLHTLTWDEEICAALDIPAAILPEIVPSVGIIGEVSVGPLAGTPIAGILGDQQAAAFGQACFEPGEVKNTYGTGNFLLMNTGGTPVPSEHGLITTVAYKIRDDAPAYALEGSVAVTGSLIQWLRDNLGLITSAPEVEGLARSVPDNGGAYIVPAFSGLFAPYWDSSARGVITGLTRYVNKGHIARAALEATAFQTREVMEAMNADASVPVSAIRVDGGMVANELLMQFQADIANVPVVRPAVIETTALGAAYAAGIAVGFWNGIEDIRANWREDRSWTPAMDEDTRAGMWHQWNKAVQRTRGWVE